jgi:hypothetical protein
MSYLTAWRLQLASQKLRTTRAGTAEIAKPSAASPKRA